MARDSKRSKVTDTFLGRPLADLGTRPKTSFEKSQERKALRARNPRTSNPPPADGPPRPPDEDG